MRRENFYSICIKLTAILSLLTCGCKKLVDTAPPPTAILGSSAYSSDATAVAVLNGLYSQLSASPLSSPGSIPSFSLYGGLSADEFSLWNGVTNNTQLSYYRNALTATSQGGYEFWAKTYSMIFIANSAIEGLEGAGDLSSSVKKQLLGEAKFMRALFYFYLVNLYGDVPLLLTTDYKVNTTTARTPKNIVYGSIVLDLKEAQSLLADGYMKADAMTVYPSAASAERVRPNKFAAVALLARVYLYTGDFSNAESLSSLVINNTAYYSLPALNNVFLKNSTEAIWQLQPVNSGWNTEDARFFIYPTSAGPSASNPVYISTSLLSSFENGDQRKLNGNWLSNLTVAGTTYWFPSKYKVYLQNASINTPAGLTEYEMVLRLGEQYLIRAEARAQLGNLTGAQSDLNAIRLRAGLQPTTASNQSTLLAAIMHERQVELFSELGHRWLDLKRFGQIDQIMTAATISKGGTWNSNQQLYPVYFGDILMNSNLTQNPGY